MSPVPSGSELDQMLEKPEPYLEDAGFTSRVLAALPERRSADRARSLVLVGAALAAGVVFAAGPLRSLWSDALAKLAVGEVGVSVIALGALSVAVLCTTALSAMLREAEG